MRQSQNRTKDKSVAVPVVFHRVIIPLYIPGETGYYKDAYSIFEMCLSSLQKTTVTPVKISVVANGCCNSVHEKLQQLYQNNQIDELILVRDAIGKVNSILKVLRTAQERLITITDADVLFCNGWEKAVLKVFEGFPKAGAVCPTPVFRKHNNYTHNIWFDYFFSKKLRFTPVQNPKAMTRFANSLGWPWLDDKYKDVYLTLEAKNGLKAMVGCSHFVATYKREVFGYMPNKNSKYLLGGDSIGEYLDRPVIKAGGYRLSTANNYAYHMGNALEEWHVETFEKLKQENKEMKPPGLADLKPNKLSYFFKTVCFRKLMSFSFMKHWFYKKKGLKKEQLKVFLPLKK